MRVALRVSGGRNAGQEIPVQYHRFLIGRGEDCHLRANSTQVSRHHCGIHVEKGKVWMHDYGSRNGTFVKGVRITEPRRLDDGDDLQVGPLRFTITIEVPAAHDTGLVPTGDTSMAGKLRTTLRAIQRHEAQASEGDILEILSQPEPQKEPLPITVRKPDPVNPADAAVDGLKRLFTPKKQ
jgi:predicted component of type VI protein secretion system